MHFNINFEESSKGIFLYNFHQLDFQVNFAMALSSARVKSYFLSPITTIPPEGPIRLGSIIEDPSYVQEPINNPPASPGSAGEKVYLHNAANSTVTLNASKSFALGLFVKFQQLLQGKIGGKTSSAVEETWSFSNLQTQWFTPSDDYIKQSLQQMEVQEFIAQNYSWLRRTKLYMVTGVMIAEGASSAIKAAKQNELHLSLGVDTPLPQVPITVLPHLDLEGASGVTKSQEKSDTVVFAFQLRKIKISPLVIFHTRSIRMGLCYLFIKITAQTKRAIRLLWMGSTRMMLILPILEWKVRRLM